MEYYDIIILGGGASGLAASIMAKTETNRILLIEHNDRVGKKLLSTGNGKCNLTNRFCRVEGEDFAENPEGIAPFYTSGDPAFPKEVIRRFDAEDTLAFFRLLGMLPLDKNGYIYPRSEQASAVLDMLRFRVDEAGVAELCGYQPMKIRRTKTGFQIDEMYACRKLILAAGGRSASKTGSDGTGYEFAKRLGHRIVPPVPALCALQCSDSFLKELKGVRTDARLTLFEIESGAKKEVMSVFGNLQLNESGISGIPVFQLSLKASRLLQEGEKLEVKINFLPEFSAEELAAAFREKPDNPLLGVLHKKLAHVIEKEAKKICYKNGEACLARLIQEFKVHPVKAAPFETAQTTLGGVSTDEIDPHTMESKKVPGLYFTGEIMDVSGICGGYNLQWAWSTAYVAAQAIRKHTP